MVCKNVRGAAEDRFFQFNRVRALEVRDLVVTERTAEHEQVGTVAPGQHVTGPSDQRIRAVSAGEMLIAEGSIQDSLAVTAGECLSGRPSQITLSVRDDGDRQRRLCGTPMSVALGVGEGVLGETVAGQLSALVRNVAVTAVAVEHER